MSFGLALEARRRRHMPGNLPFRETKHVHWDIEGKPKEWWYPYHR